MKAEWELQRAHDVPLELDPKNKLLLSAAPDVLCWALEHGHNKKFAENLTRFEDEASELGYLLERSHHAPN